MSVKDLEGALALKTNTRLAIVSEVLFFALDNLNKIELKQLKKELPDDMYQTGPVRAYLRQFIEKSERQLLLTYFVLVSHPDVHLDCVLLHRFRLDDMGPNSFMLCGADF